MTQSQLLVALHKLQIRTVSISDVMTFLMVETAFNNVAVGTCTPYLFLAFELGVLV